MAQRQTPHDAGPHAHGSTRSSAIPRRDLFESAWDPEVEPDQWNALVDLLTELNPHSIGIGTNTVQAHSDGLTASLRDALMAVLPARLASRVVTAGHLGIRWLET